jgi:hypothetical protein
VYIYLGEGKGHCNDFLPRLPLYLFQTVSSRPGSDRKMSVRWSNNHKDTQKIDGMECTKVTKWHVTSRPDDLYEAVSGGWGPIEALRGLLIELKKVTSDVDPAHVFTIKQKLDNICENYNAKEELLFRGRVLPERFRECIVSERVSLMRWTWAAPELCFYRVLKNPSKDTWIETL